MLVEVFILDSDHGVLHVVGNFVEGDVVDVVSTGGGVESVAFAVGYNSAGIFGVDDSVFATERPSVKGISESSDDQKGERSDAQESQPGAGVLELLLPAAQSGLDAALKGRFAVCDRGAEMPRARESGWFADVDVFH